MLEKWNALTTMAYIRFVLLKQDLKDLKNDERGLSGIVVAVLLILVAVLAVVILWGSLSGWLGEMWEKITGKANEIN